MNATNNFATLSPNTLRYTPSYSLDDVLAPGFLSDPPYRSSWEAQRKKDLMDVPLIGVEVPRYLDMSPEKSKGFDLVNKVVKSNGLSDAFELILVALFTHSIPRWRKKVPSSHALAIKLWEDLKSEFQDRIRPETLISCAVVLLPDILQKVSQTVFERRFGDSDESESDSPANASDLFSNMVKVTLTSDIEKIFAKDVNGKSDKDPRLLDAIIRVANLQALMAILRDCSRAWKWESPLKDRAYRPIGLLGDDAYYGAALTCYPIVVEKYSVDEHPEFLLAAAYGVPTGVIQQIVEPISFGSEWMTAAQSARAFISFLFDYIYSDA